MVRHAAAVLIALSPVSAAVHAEDADTPPPDTAAPTSIRASIAKIRFDREGRYPFGSPPRSSHDSAATTVSAGVFGGAAAGAISGVWLASR